MATLNNRLIMFRFTIRDVLWLTALVAVCVGWFSNRASFLKERAAMLTYQHKVAVERADLERQMAILRLAVLRQRELDGKVILPTGDVR